MNNLFENSTPNISEIISEVINNLHMYTKTNALCERDIRVLSFEIIRKRFTHIMNRPVYNGINFQCYTEQTRSYICIHNNIKVYHREYALRQASRYMFLKLALPSLYFRSLNIKWMFLHYPLLCNYCYQTAYTHYR